MATHTTYYNLTKPAQNDKVNIGVLNDNADIIDTALHNKVDSDDLTANNVMMSDGVTSVEDRLDAHTFGTIINLTSYTSANPYITTSDGYIQCETASSGAYVLIAIRDANDVIIYTGANQTGTHYQACYVKKGLKIYHHASSGTINAKFYPLQ